MNEFAILRQANAARQQEWDPARQISLAYRGNELAGEVGEACNVLKKIERERLGIRGSRANVEELAEELADVVICVDLIAMGEGIDLWQAVLTKFNATSEKVGLQTRLAATGPDNGENEQLRAEIEKLRAALLAAEELHQTGMINAPAGLYDRVQKLRQEALAIVPSERAPAGENTKTAKKIDKNHDKAIEDTLAPALELVNGALIVPRLIEDDDGEPGDVEFLIGMLRAVASGELDAKTAKAVAKSGLDLYEKGSRRCAEERGEFWEPEDRAALTADSGEHKK
jgi:NTP pyrophosphatase (non-canonical NTP hydrolase)